MRFLSWLDGRNLGPARRRGKRGQPRSLRRQRLLLERLEDRNLLDGSSSTMLPPALVADPGSYEPHSILVRFRPGAAAPHAAEVVAGTTDGRAFALVPGLRVVHLGEGVGVADALGA